MGLVHARSGPEPSQRSRNHAEKYVLTKFINPSCYTFLYQKFAGVLVYSDGGVGASEICVSMTLSSVKKIIGKLQLQHGSKSFNISSNCINDAAPVISSISVETTTAEEIISTDLSNHCCLLIMPGGRDLPYVEKLQGKGNRNISNFVRNGGSYLGICAGAYYGCSSVQFAQGDPLLEVIGSRELALFPGISQGPVFAGFDYASNEGAMAADIQLTQAGSEMFDFYKSENAMTLKFTTPVSDHDDVTITSYTAGKIPNRDTTPLQIYYNGGCHFMDDSLTDDTAFRDFPSLATPTSFITSPYYKVLATYAAPNKYFTKFTSVRREAIKQGPLSAIIAGQYGRGRVVLSGVHFEASSELLKKHYKDDPYIESLQPHIASSDTGREKLLLACIKYLLNDNE